MGSWRSIRPVWQLLVKVLLVVFLMDVAARRIAWDAVAIRRFIREHVHRLGWTRQRSDAQAVATLAALKSRVAQVNESWRQTGEANQRSVEHVDLTNPSATDQQSSPMTTVNRVAVPPPSPTVARQAASDGDRTATTRRLLDAKRRAAGGSESLDRD